MVEKHEGYSADGPIQQPTSTPDVGTTAVSPTAAANAENRAPGAMPWSRATRVEVLRAEMMRRFSDRLSMDEIADFAYDSDVALFPEESARPRSGPSAENRASGAGEDVRANLTFGNLTIQSYPYELDYVNATLHDRGPACEDNSFLGMFCRTCLRADGFNYPLLRPALIAFMEKYPADPERLRMERVDSGREQEELSNRDDVQDAAAGER